MHIEHIALWVKNLEVMKDFYCRYFNLTASEKYINLQKEFSSYFLSFENGSRIEIMHKPGIESLSDVLSYGWAHIAISVGSEELVDKLTEILRSDGYRVSGNLRITGDGYYESVILDPEGNQVEITV